MRAILVLTGVLFASCVLPGPTSAQSPKGMALCLAGCAKSDKGCQDRCVPARDLGTEARACIASCRQRASEPDVVVEMTTCLSACFGGVTD